MRGSAADVQLPSHCGVDRAVVATKIGEHATSVIECGTARRRGGSFDLYEGRTSAVEERGGGKNAFERAFRATR